MAAIETQTVIRSARNSLRRTRIAHKEIGAKLPVDQYLKGVNAYLSREEKEEVYLRLKHEKIFFSFFEPDSEKVLQWADFETLFTKIKEYRGEWSVEYKIVREAMESVWHGLLSSVYGGEELPKLHHDDHHLDHKNILIPVKAWNQLWGQFDAHKMPMWQREYLKYMFFLIDRNGDKVIDIDEYTETMMVFGSSSREARLCFKRLSMDPEGKATLDFGQFVNLFTEYFREGNRGKAAGNFLFGDKRVS